MSSIWQSWSNVPLSERDCLPNTSGIYIVADNHRHVWYVGKSINLKTRWQGKGHHRYRQLSRSNKNKQYKLYWHPFPVEQLDQKENYYIDKLCPDLNSSRVRRYARRLVQPGTEISRIFKVINHKTLLFPNLRSLVLGFYSHIEEDSDPLQELICIVVLVNINDHDSVILKSFDKSFSRKGRRLKNYWKVYEPNHEKKSDNIRPMAIPVFLINNIVYEFVCSSSLLNIVEERHLILKEISIENQVAFTLKNIDLLPSLIDEAMNTESYYMPRELTYLRFRWPDLYSMTELTSDLQ